ncbi:MAG: MFS transporter, partial [Sporolactobacillus sp.]
QWVIHQVHGSTNLIGQACLINSLMIIVGQIIFIKIGRHEKKTQSLGVSTFLLAVSYAVLFFSGQIKDGSTAALLVMSSFALSAYGELLLFSNLPALVNERTSDEGRGRANSLMNGAWQVGGILGPVGAGIGAHQAKSILILFITIVLIAGLLFAHVQKKLNKERKG